MNDGNKIPALGYGTWLGMDEKQDGVDEKIDYLETWRGFETVLKKGLAKSIGVSNFNVEQMKRLLANCKVPPSTNQVEYQRGIVSIPKTVTPSRVVENASIFDFELDKDDMATLAKFDNGFRTVRPFFWQDYQNYPFEKIPDKMEIPESLRIWKNGLNLDID
ncbi:hypothetical protein HF086_004216 [Spodoptera exigua]|uniref:NADP-dependent oxidoreductase domain-containing protein n=1 Tax=Spodoptera exigua TaxID=7107 RepID=A0A922SIK2_SPOEX|nr:hypothetical protein HF086_004216 [Spodoptera exigua]